MILYYSTQRDAQCSFHIWGDTIVWIGTIHLCFHRRLQWHNLPKVSAVEALAQGILFEAFKKLKKTPRRYLERRGERIHSFVGSSYYHLRLLYRKFQRLICMQYTPLNHIKDIEKNRNHQWYPEVKKSIIYKAKCEVVSKKYRKRLIKPTLEYLNNPWLGQGPLLSNFVASEG